LGAYLRSIAIVSEDLSYPLDEGFKKACVSLALAIARQGAAVSVFSRRAEGLPSETHHLPANKLLVGASLRRDLAALGPEALLYVPEAAATPMSLVRARMLKAQARGAPVVVLSLQRRTYPGMMKALARWLAPALVLVLSERTRAAAVAAGLRAEQVTPGVDAEVFRPPRPGEKASLRGKYGLPDGKVMLHVGHISPARNLKLLARTLAPGRHLAVVASTSTRADPRVRRELAGASVTFLDQYIEHVDEVYRLADCYVFPTLSDRGAIEIPLSVLEAMATNLPVVTTGFGGLADLFARWPDGRKRGLFMAASQREFAEQVDAALGLTDVATRPLVSDLSWDLVAGRVLDLMAQVCPSGSGER
jgi:glycosyltransferase involved in cell wall biosynthesis